LQRIPRLDGEAQVAVVDRRERAAEDTDDFQIVTFSGCARRR
jgi:hypothetical protein